MHHKKLITISILLCFVLVGIAAVRVPAPVFKNLQVLPKDISAEKLDSIMESYNKALGVNCKFCHVPFTKEFPDSLDFASDKEHRKEDARRMMRMTIHINKTYFNFENSDKPEFLKTVHCNTCHRGEAFPEQ